MKLCHQIIGWKWPHCLPCAHATAPRSQVWFQKIEWLDKILLPMHWMNKYYLGSAPIFLVLGSWLRADNFAQFLTPLVALWTRKDWGLITSVAGPVNQQPTKIEYIHLTASLPQMIKWNATGQRCEDVSVCACVCECAGAFVSFSNHL